MSDSSQPTVANLLGLARTAEVGNNLAEAEIYYTRVLEIDPTISEAWIGKGKAAGWQSSMSNMRFGELLTAFGHAIGTIPIADKQQVMTSCVFEVNKLVSTLYGMARKHMLEYVALQNTWANYLGQIQQMLSALETAQGWLPNDKNTLENIVHLCKDNIEGVTFRDQFDNNTPKGWHLSDQYEALLTQKLSAASEKLKTLDPSYAAPQIEKKKPDSCFVVTATMGDPEHPTVLLMRRFRDQWLLSKPWGELVVERYYRYGPAAARFISRSQIRRVISYNLVVAPAAWLAKRVVK